MSTFDHPLDPRRADVRVEIGVARAEVNHSTINRLTAEQWAAFADVLDEARNSPDVFVDPLLPMRRKDRLEFAERAAAADLAVRLGMSESTVRSQAHDATSLRARLPRFWAMFGEGEVSAANARTVADLLTSLPDESDVAAFDTGLVEIAGQAPVRFRLKARSLRERVHSIPLVERVAAARTTRGVWVDNDIDGMAFLTFKAPAEEVHGVFSRIDATARSMAGRPDESRTLAQIRADVAVGFLSSDAGATPARASVGVLVPVMTLLGTSDEPGTLDGYGPIDAETARRIAAHAPSFTRLLTHPVTGALLDIDRTTYRPPADLKRWLEVTDQFCSFPGCGRKASSSDLDLTVDHQFGGATSAANLAHLCRHHHRLKHQTRWNARASHTKERRKVSWTSPTGYHRDSDPPPF